MRAKPTEIHFLGKIKRKSLASFHFRIVFVFSKVERTFFGLFDHLAELVASKQTLTRSVCSARFSSNFAEERSFLRVT